jgi:hypothetical protein
MNNKHKTNSINDNIGEQYFEKIRKKTLWEEYVYDIEKQIINAKIRSKMKALDSPVKVQIPLKKNVRYEHIRNFEDHNLSNNLLLDMIIRNLEFQDYIYYSEVIDTEFENKDSKLKEKHYKKLQYDMVEKFGFDIKEVLNLIAHHPYINEQIVNYIENVANENLVLNPPFICDIKDGIKRVMDFYLEKKQLYIMIPTDYEKVNNQDIEKMKSNNKKLSVKIINPMNGQEDYILLSVYEEHKPHFKRIDNYFYKLPSLKEIPMDWYNDEIIKKSLRWICIPVNTFEKEKLVSLAEENFPIEFLDNEFISSISDDDMIEHTIKDSLVQSILPDIKFNNSRNINIRVNPDLSAEELMAQIVNLKLNENVKSFVEVFNKEIEEIEGIKNLKAIAKDKKLRNRDYANAFWIYDLYKIIGKEFYKKELELQQEAEIQIEKINVNVQYSKQIKQHEYDKIDEKLQKHLKLFSKTALDIAVHKLTGVELSKMRQLYALLKEYIDGDKFKNIILGK